MNHVVATNPAILGGEKDTFSMAINGSSTMTSLIGRITLTIYTQICLLKAITIIACLTNGTSRQKPVIVSRMKVVLNLAVNPLLLDPVHGPILNVPKQRSVPCGTVGLGPDFLGETIIISCAMKLQYKYEDTFRANKNHTSIVGFQSVGGFPRLSTVVGGAVVKALLAKGGVTITSHDQNIMNGLAVSGYPTSITFHFRSKRVDTGVVLDGDIEVPRTGNDYPADYTVNLRVPSGSVTNMIYNYNWAWSSSTEGGAPFTANSGDPFRTFDSLATEVGYMLMGRAQYGSVIPWKADISIADPASNAVPTLISSPYISTAQLSIECKQLIKVRNVTENDAGNFDTMRLDQNPLEGEIVTMSGIGAKFRENVIRDMGTGATTVANLFSLRGNRQLLGNEATATSASKQEAIAGIVNEQITSDDALKAMTRDQTHSLGYKGMLWKPNYKNLFSNVKSVKKVRLNPAQAKYLSQKYFFNGTLEYFLRMFLDFYVETPIGQTHFLVMRQAFPGHLEPETEHQLDNDGDGNHHNVKLDFCKYSTFKSHMQLKREPKMPTSVSKTLDDAVLS